MTDTDRLYKLLQREGPRGVHTHDLRKEGYSGNPSQRATDVETKFGVTVKRVTEFRNGRNGSRFKLIGLTAEKRSTRPSRLCRESDEPSENLMLVDEVGQRELQKTAGIGAEGSSGLFGDCSRRSTAPSVDSDGCSTRSLGEPLPVLGAANATPGVAPSDHSCPVDTDDTSLKGQTEAGVGVDPGGAIPLFEEHRPPTAYDPFSQAA